MLGDDDLADLERIASAWSCSKAEAAALTLRATFARWRREAPELGPLGLEAAASAGALGLAVPARIGERLEARLDPGDEAVATPERVELAADDQHLEPDESGVFGDEVATDD